MTPEICPNCGADVPPNAKACPECGSDEKTGWSEEAEKSGLDLPDKEFNYEEFAKKEFGGAEKRWGISWIGWGIALFLLVLILLFFR